MKTSRCILCNHTKEEQTDFRITLYLDGLRVAIFPYGTPYLTIAKICKGLPGSVVAVESIRPHNNGEIEVISVKEYPPIRRRVRN